MPLRCVDDRGKSIEANACTQQQWKALKSQMRLRRHLKMPCCEAQAIPKTSKLGTQFFAHKAREECLWKPETEVHRRLKVLALQAARRAGWDAQTECSGQTPEGERWTADVLAQRGAKRIAIEVQWSRQTDEETLRRQRKYRDSGVTGIWLLRQPGFPILQDLPAACVGGATEERLTIMLPVYEGMTVRDRSTREGWSQVLSPQEFLNATFEDRFHFGIPRHEIATLDILGTYNICWKCRKKIQIVTALKGNFGPKKILKYGEDSPQKLAREYPTIKKRIVNALAHQTDVGRSQFKHAFEDTYMVEYHCPRCSNTTQKLQDLKQSMWKVFGTIKLDVADCWGAFVREPPLHWAVWAVQPDTVSEGGPTETLTE